MSYNFLGLLVVAAATLAVAYGFAQSSRMPFPPRLFLAAVLLRIVGSTVRFDMIRVFYGSLADAQRYFNTGRELAELFWRLDPWVFSYEFWFGPGRWWGTAFLERLTGIVISLIGPSMRGTYLVFSLLSFAGLYLIALAVYRRRPGAGAVRFAAWIWLWPSLWFWPSSIGKEAVTILAIGLVFYGYAGRRQAIQWIPYLGGLGLAFALRPHVGGALALATVVAYWFQSWSRPGPRRLVEALVAALLAFFVLSAMAEQFGLVDVDLEGVQEFVTYRTGQTLEGGSAVGQGPSGLTAIPMAFVNIWMRPFPWDVHNLMAAFSAIEILFLWLFAATHYRVVIQALKHWRHDRLLAFSLPFLAGYTLMIGLTFANLGIIARQRTPLFPFVFMLLTAAGAYAGKRYWREAPPRRQTAARARPAPRRDTDAAALAGGAGRPAP